MKKFVHLSIAVSMITAMLFAMLPAASALAKYSGPATLNVYNNSNANLVLDLWTPGGARQAFVVAPGEMSSFVIPSGWYRYSARMDCGVKAGGIQVKVTKKLFLSCRGHSSK